jgi:hypothetical protein
MRTLLRRKMGVEITGLLGRRQSGDECEHNRQQQKTAAKRHGIVPPSLDFRAGTQTHHPKKSRRAVHTAIERQARRNSTGPEPFLASFIALLWENLCQSKNF